MCCVRPLLDTLTAASRSVLFPEQLNVSHYLTLLWLRSPSHSASVFVNISVVIIESVLS